MTAEDLTDLFFDFFNEQTGYSVVIEIDKKVAYAYLIDKSENIIGDIWLYNCGNAPEKVEWDNPLNMPFANAAQFIREDKSFQPISDISEVSVSWFVKAGALSKAHIYVRGKLFAILCPGSKPGWSVMAAVDNPIARKLVSDIS